jgi:hypothetical protein
MDQSIKLTFAMTATVVFAAACQHSQTAVQQGSRGDDRVITRERLLAGGGTTNLYDAIARVRPQCLQARSPSNTARSLKPDTTSETGGSTGVYNSAPRSISLFVDGTRTGTVDDLRTFSLADVREVECLTASDAAQRYGLNNVAGAIAVKTGRQ